MTDLQKEKIIALRTEGLSVQAISDKLMIPTGTIKSYLARRNPAPRCAYCNQVIPREQHRKNKRFCSDRCRNAWWRNNCNVSKTAVKVVCPVCGTAFTSFPSKHQTYCSKACAGRARWKRER